MSNDKQNCGHEEKVSVQSLENKDMTLNFLNFVDSLNGMSCDI